MFSLGNSEEARGFRVEWIIFAILIVGLVALWLFFEFGIPSSNHMGPQLSPDQLRAFYASATTTPPKLSPESQSIFEKSATTTPPNLSPEAVQQFLTH